MSILAYCLKNGSDRLWKELHHLTSQPRSQHFYSYLAWENSQHLRRRPPLVFPRKWRLRNERRNSIPMTRNYQDLGSASDWLEISLNPNQKHHPWNGYEIFVLVSQTSFRGETIGGVSKCQLISPQAYAYFPQRRLCSCGTWRIFDRLKTRAFTCSVHGTTLERFSLTLKNGFGKCSLFFYQSMDEKIGGYGYKCLLVCTSQINSFIRMLCS